MIHKKTSCEDRIKKSTRIDAKSDFLTHFTDIAAKGGNISKCVIPQLLFEENNFPSSHHDYRTSKGLIKSKHVSLGIYDPKIVTFSKKLTLRPR